VQPVFVRGGQQPVAPEMQQVLHGLSLADASVYTSTDGSTNACVYASIRSCAYAGTDASAYTSTDAYLRQLRQQ